MQFMVAKILNLLQNFKLTSTKFASHCAVIVTSLSPIVTILDPKSKFTSKQYRMHANFFAKDGSSLNFAGNGYFQFAVRQEIFNFDICLWNLFNPKILDDKFLIVKAFHFKLHNKHL